MKKNGIHNFCKNCLIGFQRRSTLLSHMEKCLKNNFQKLKLPTTDDCILKYKDYHKQIPHKICLYVDFESITNKVYSCSPNPSTSFTEVKQIHTPISYFLAVIEDNDKLIYSKFYCGENAIDSFFHELQALS